MPACPETGSRNSVRNCRGRLSELRQERGAMHKRLAFIDTLRGIAVLSVLLQHALEVIVSNHPTGEYYWVFHNAIGYYFNFGRFGVVLFFFVSGFVIPFIFPHTATPARDFATHRF